MAYQNVVIGTGAESVRPAIEGLDEQGVFTLRWIEEALEINSYIESHRAKNVILIGAGYINLELADRLTRRRLDVTLIERNPTVLKTVDGDLGTLVEAHLRQHGRAA
jgi:NADPH-dependent 2,4-dienoyl-CoA reductase/sulfur reductase-like enzyme